MDSISYMLCYTYRPPSSLQNCNQDIELSLGKAFTENKENTMFGDFNYNFSNGSTPNTMWNHIVNSYNVHQLINMPTRVTSTSSTIIDLSK